MKLLQYLQLCLHTHTYDYCEVNANVWLLLTIEREGKNMLIIERQRKMMIKMMIVKEEDTG